MSSKDSNHSFSVSANGEEDNAISFPDRVNVDGIWVPTSYQTNPNRFLPISTQAANHHTEALQSGRENTPGFLGWSPQQPVNMAENSSPNNAHLNEDNRSLAWGPDEEGLDYDPQAPSLPPPYMNLEGREYLAEDAPAGNFRDAAKETIERIL